MKNFSVLTIGLSLLLYCATGWCNGTTDQPTGAASQGSAANTLTITSSPELSNLTTTWANEYERLNPAVKINIAKTGEDQAKVAVSFISNEVPQGVKDGEGWNMVVGRDAIVAVVNAKNPMLSEIYHQGISAEEFAQLFSTPAKRNWNSMIQGGQDVVIKTYLVDNEKVNEAIGRFTAIDNATLIETKVSTSAEFVSDVQKDVYAIGFCRLTDVRDAATNTIVKGLQLLPIDKNQNGRIDNFENIYTNMDAFTRGIWIGKYPYALCGNIYAVSSTQPTDENAVAFLTWVTTNGQKYLNQNGYSDLASREVKANIDALTGKDMVLPQDNPKSFISRTWLINLLVLCVVGLIVAALVRYIKKQNLTVQHEGVEITPVLNENLLLAPKGLYFDKTHTWAFMEEDGNVKVGIDDFLQHITGTLTRIHMKNPGERVRKGEKIMTIVHGGKQLNIYAPISGVIREQNRMLLTDSSLINSAPFTEGWVYVLEPKNWVREIQFLFMGETYKEWLSDEFIRLKDFFAATVRSNKAVYAHIILQDGGELTDNVLADMGPEVWEDFQTKFIDTSK
jgi:glycine cleavage system H lipoate-binding protein/ABC-type phosphate transport system substrate-binding protein